MAAPETTLLYANGLNGATGAYLLEQPPEEVAAAAVGERIQPDHLREMQFKHHSAADKHYAPIAGLDANDLGKVGWGVVLPAGADPRRLDPLRPLLEMRKQQAGRYYREFTGPNGYAPDGNNGGPDTHLSFLTRQAAGPGPADPKRVPYYLLLVGGPEEIPFEFQYQLDIQYGVGRVHFDTAEEYAAYAAAVLAAEAGPPLRPRRAEFFGTRNADDEATRLSAELLVGPLADTVAAEFTDWSVQRSVGSAATRARLSALLGGADTPALLMTAGHGLAFPEGHDRQFAEQGALVCQDWPGPLEWQREVPPAMAFSAADVGGDVRGLVAVFFACYGAGTPRLDDYPHRNLDARPSIAPRPFLARLPRRLLASGALAVVGHVERAWPYAFRWRGNARLGTFEGMLRLLLMGHRVGWALDQFNVGYAELAAALSEILFQVRYGFQADPLELSFLWMAHNDARAYVVLGDPAVRLSASGAAVA
jgi:hypothetical protein